MFSRIHAPRSTGDVRLGYDVAISTPPLPSSPQRFGSVERHAAELIAAHVRDAVVQREPLVHEGVVRRQQIEHAAVLAEDAVDEQLHLLAERRRAGRRRSSGRRLGSGSMSSSAAHVEPLEREVRDERLRRAGRPAAPHLRLEHLPASFSLPFSASASSSSSGSRLQRKNDSRDASSRSLMRVDAPGCESAGDAARRDTGTSGSRESPCSASRMPSSKPPVARAALVEARTAPRGRSSVTGRRNARRASVRDDLAARTAAPRARGLRAGRRRSCCGSACRSRRSD